MSVRLFIAALLLPALSGCGTAEFYWQGIRRAARPFHPRAADCRGRRIDARSEAQGPAGATRRRSARYASRELGLPDNGSYTRYADLGRPFVVWNVFAAPELSLSPRQWCFPVAGLRQLPRIFRRDRRARGSRAPRGGGRRRSCGRRAGLFDARLFRRPGAVHLHRAIASPTSPASSSTSSRTRSSMSRTTRRSTSRLPSPSRKRA